MTPTSDPDFMYEPGHPPTIPARVTVAEYRCRRRAQRRWRWARRLAQLAPKQRSA